MKTESLEIFLTVAEEGNFTHAAELLHMSQPSVSRTIMELEEELRCKLFRRTNKNVALTEQGSRFLETARHIVLLYRKAVDESDGGEAVAGDIYIGAGEVGAVGQLAEIISAFHSRHPAVRFHMESGNAGAIMEKLDKGVLDVGLITRSASTANHVSVELPRKEIWGALMRSDHPFASLDQIQAEALARETLIVPENPVFYRELTNWIGADIKPAVTYTLVHNVVPLVKRGMGVLLCFKDSVDHQEGLSFVPLFPAKEVTALLVWKHRPVMSPELALFTEFVMQKLHS